MSDLNGYIEKAQQYTAAARDGIPATDHTDQSAYGVDIARRAAAAAQQEPAAVRAMPPIVPVAN